jgi:hypothetical protein
MATENRMDLKLLAFERELEFLIGGEWKKGRIYVGELVKATPTRWACHWSISYICPEKGRIYGDDPLDALFGCLRFVGRLIRGSEEDGLVVKWRLDGDHAGFEA